MNNDINFYIGKNDQLAELVEWPVVPRVGEFVFIGENKHEVEEVSYGGQWNTTTRKYQLKKDKPFINVTLKPAKTL